MKLKSTEKAYIAGLIDGEGSIFICKQKRWKSGKFGYQLRIVVGMNDRAPIEYLKKKLDGGFTQTIKYKNKNWRTSYRWVLCDERASNLLKKIKKYLLVKNKEAEIGIELRRTFKKKNHKYREHLYQKISKTTRKRTNNGRSNIKKDKNKKSLYGY